MRRGLVLPKPAGPLDMLRTVLWATTLQANPALSAAPLSPTRCSQRSESQQKGRHLNESGGGDLFFLVNNMKQALPPHHHHSYHEYGQTSRSTLRDTAEHLRRIPGASDQLTGPLSRGGCGLS